MNNTILLCGIPSEPPLAMVARALDKLHAPYILFNQRKFNQADCEFTVTSGGITGKLALNGAYVPLEEITSVYTRLMDFRLLPELRGIVSDDPIYLHCRLLHETISRWYEIAPGRVVNRSRSMGSNSSKPYQSQIIRKYFDVPETIITNDPEDVVVFLERHSSIIYKSISGVRSIVQPFSDDDLERLPLLRWCPAQFQQRIEGIDVRVHVVGEEVFATSILSEGVDYRYAHHQNHETATLEAAELPSEIEEACIYLSRDLGLALAGIDLKFTNEGKVYCFEVNPSPAFSSYETTTNQPISHALARYLAYLN